MMDTRKNPSSDTKLVARHAISTFGAPPSVWRFTCEREEFSLDIGGCADRPAAGVVSYTTIGLSDYGVMTGGGIARPRGVGRRLCVGSAVVSQHPGRGGDAVDPPAERSQAGRCHSRRGCRVLSPRYRIASLSDPPVSLGRAASSRCAARRRTSPGFWPSPSPAASCSAWKRKAATAWSNFIASGGSTCTAWDGRRGWREIRSMNQLAAARLAHPNRFQRTKAQSRSRCRRSQ